MSKKLIFKCLETGEVGDYRYWAEKGYGYGHEAIKLAVKTGKPTKVSKQHFVIESKLNPNRCDSDETKIKRIETWRKTRAQRSPEYLAKLNKQNSASKKRYFKTHDGTFLGKKHSVESRKKISEAQKRVWSNPTYKAMKIEQNIKNIKSGKMKACYIYDNLTFDSSWELYFYLFCKIGGNTIERNVCYDLPNDKHTFIDFKVNGKLYEIKGPQFFNENGNLFNCYNNELYAEKQKFYEDFNVTIITDIEPYAKVVDSYYNKGYVAMFNTKLDFPYDDPIYKCHCRNKKSPYEAFYDFTLRQKAVDNRLCYGRVSRYEGDPNKPLEARDIITAFNVTKMAPKVSELSTTRIKTILDNYEIKTLVNPFAGFGNTSIYCKQKGINYKGYDINNIRSIEGIEIADVTKIVDENYYDVLFACPPYSDKESWLVEMPEIKTCDDWIDVCLHNFPNCKQYVFIVDETKHPYTLLSNKNHLNKKSAEKLVKIN